MNFFFLLGLVFTKLDPDTLKELHKEDIRMASHLRSHGYKVSNPKYPLLGEVVEVRTKTPHQSHLLSLEDSRMMGHLRDEGWTVI